MNRNEIMDLIRSLAKSQGLYGRILANIEALNAEDYERLMTALEAENFKDSVDFIMWVES